MSLPLRKNILESTANLLPLASKTIDYRCDNEKKTLELGSWDHCVADDSRIPKMPVISPLQALVHPQTQKKKKTILHGLSMSNPNFSEFAFFWLIYLQFCT
jgi:hypothetical protein